MASCGQQNNNAKNEVSEEKATYDQIVLDTLIAKADNFIEKNVAFSGTVTHVCKHGGQKLFVFGSSEENSIKVAVGENYSEFPVELEGSTVEMQGVLKEQRIDETYLAEWEAEIKNGTTDETEAQEVEEGEHHEGEAHKMEKSHEKNSEDFEKIAELRKKIEESEKGYLSNFSVECVNYKVVNEAPAEKAEEMSPEE